MPWSWRARPGASPRCISASVTLSGSARASWPRARGGRTDRQPTSLFMRRSIRARVHRRVRSKDGDGRSDAMARRLSAHSLIEVLAGVGLLLVAFTAPAMAQDDGSGLDENDQVVL